MLIEIHILKNYSPSNLNRDDLGAPKTCFFGGVPRARISSQCIKRSIRNPGNIYDVHNKGPGIFAQAMKSYMAYRTKLFPWLVEQELKKSDIPEQDHSGIVLYAQKIATGKEKKSKDKDSDDRPKTPQLIHVGPGHVRQLVKNLEIARRENEVKYKYLIEPKNTFEQLVREKLETINFDEKEVKKIVGICWVIANVKERMDKLLGNSEGEEPDTEPEKSNGLPGLDYANYITDKLSTIFYSDQPRYKELTKKASQEEKAELQTEQPAPKGMKEFMEELNNADRSDAVDIALFGRMTTSSAFKDVEAAMQVAHAISTNRAVNQTDYFSAVDDYGITGGGAGHVDTALLNSACYYKYFCLDWDQLIYNLGGDESVEDNINDQGIRKTNDEVFDLASCSLGHFIRAAALTSPTGKQNSFAAHNEVSGILIEIKKYSKIPTNYANAFAEPIERIGAPEDDALDEKSIIGRSVACLADHVHAVRAAYGIESELLWYSPKLWKFPFHYWKRSTDGKKEEMAPLAKKSFEALGGSHEGEEGLIDEVMKTIGADWGKVKRKGESRSEESTS
jgi:hypothetical protein